MTRPVYRLPEKLPQNLPAEARLLPRPAALDGYVRVSYLGGRANDRSFISPQLQTNAIHSYLAAHDLALGRLSVELGRSGTDPDRPELAALLKRIEAGHSGGLVVARLDRLGRSVVQTLRLLERIEAAGARFVSVEDGFDSSTPLGRALLTILLALAQLELDRLAESSREARARAVRRGVHPCVSAPTGYRRGPDGDLEPDPDHAPAIAAAFERRAAGATYSAVATLLTQAGVPPPPKAKRWSGPCAYRLFQNPVYVGEAYSGAVRNPHAHPPLVRRGLWLAAHAAAARAFEDAHATSLLGGIVRCGSCHHPLRYCPSEARSATEPRGRPSRYACRHRFRSGDCERPAAATADLLEPAIVTPCLRALNAYRPKPQLEAELRAAEDRLAALEATTPRHKFQSAVYSSENEVADARRRVLRLWRQLQLAHLTSTPELRRRWPTLARLEQRHVLHTALDAALLFPGNEPAHARLKLVFAGSPSRRSLSSAAGGCTERRYNRPS